MAKKKSKKGSLAGEAGAAMLAAGFAGEILGNILGQVVSDGVGRYMNKNGKKKANRLIKKWTSSIATSRKKSSRPS